MEAQIVHEMKKAITEMISDVEAEIQSDFVERIDLLSRNVVRDVQNTRNDAMRSVERAVKSFEKKEKPTRRKPEPKPEPSRGSKPLTMSDLKKNIILEGMISWPSIASWVVGSALLMGGWAFSSLLTGFVGFCVFTGGIGWSLTSLTMRYDSIKAKVMRQIAESIRAERNKKLDELDAKLTQDKDPRDQDALRDLRSIYNEFEEFAEANRMPDHVRDAMIVRINELFDACVKNLQICYDLWDTSRSLRGNGKQKLLANRETILLDVVKSVENFTNVVTSIMTLSYKDGELGEVNTKLDSELAACLRVEQQIRNLERPEENPAFAEYLN